MSASLRQSYQDNLVFALRVKGMKVSLRHAYHAYFVASKEYSSGRDFLLVDLMREHAYMVHAAVKNCLKGSIKQELEAANSYEEIALKVVVSEFAEKQNKVANLKWHRIESLIALRQIRLNKAVWGVRLP